MQDITNRKALLFICDLSAFSLFNMNYHGAESASPVAPMAIEFCNYMGDYGLKITRDLLQGQ